VRLQVTLAEPDGMWSQPEGKATHGFYSSVEWKNANKAAKWLTKNVPGDGMCGWVAIMLIIGWLTLNDMVLLRNKQPCGWKPDGWMKVLDFLREVSIFIRTTLRGPRTNLTDHLVSAIESSLNGTLGDGITHDQSSYDMKKFRALQLADLLCPPNQQPIEQPATNQQLPQDLWFSAEYGNFVSAMLERPIVVMSEVHDERNPYNPKVSFAFYTPRPVTSMARGVPGLKYQFGTWTAYSFQGLRKVFRESGISNPVHLKLTQVRSHFQPFYKKLPGAQLTLLCPL
jgi:hypothetical protein